MKKAYLSVIAALVSAITFAQEKKAELDININKNGDSGANWYSSPLVWVIGAAVFILLLVALTRGRRVD